MLNQEAPMNIADILPAEETLSVDCKRPSEREIKKAIKTEKQQGAWSIQYTCRSTHSGQYTSAQIIYELLGQIWEVDEVPAKWIEGHIVKLPKKGI